MCQIIIGQCVQLSLDNVSNNHVNVRQDFFALAIICPIFFHLNLILSNQMWFVRHRRCQRCQLSANPGYMGGGGNSCLSTGLGVDQYLSLIWRTLHCAIYDTLKDMIQCIIHWTIRAVSMLIEFWTIHTRMDNTHTDGLTDISV